MQRSEEWQRVLQQARRVLRRYRDGETRERRDDIVQDACLLVWQWSDQIRDRSRLGSAVHTIAKRQRSRALAAARKNRQLQFVEFGEAGVVDPAASVATEQSLLISEKPVPLRWAKRRLARVLSSLSSLDQHLLLGFHEGFCCAELASRFGRTEGCVKTRIHRARRRVRSVFEDLVRTSGDLQDSEAEE